MDDKKRRLFEQDRRMELKMRIATKRLKDTSKAALPEFGVLESPKPELVDRLIERVRRL